MKASMWNWKRSVIPPIGVLFLIVFSILCSSHAVADDDIDITIHGGRSIQLIIKNYREQPLSLIIFLVEYFPPMKTVGNYPRVIRPYSTLEFDLTIASYAPALLFLQVGVKSEGKLLAAKSGVGLNLGRGPIILLFPLMKTEMKYVII
jgi:hypothetical protein